jgi:hypothetical protein
VLTRTEGKVRREFPLASACGANNRMIGNFIGRPDRGSSGPDLIPIDSVPAAAVGSESKPLLHCNLDFGELVLGESRKEAHELDRRHASNVLRVEHAG